MQENQENLDNKTPECASSQDTDENVQEKAAQSEAQESAPKPQKGAKKPFPVKWIAIIGTAAALVAVIAAIIIVMVLNKPEEQGLILTPGDYTSPTALAMSEDGEHLYIADATGQTVYKVRVSDKSIRAVYNSDLSVQDVAVSGDDVLVAVGGLGGKLVKLSSELEKQSEVVTGHTPTDIYVTSGKAYVANRFSNTVSCVDIASMKESANIVVGRQPIALTLAGNEIYVGCFITDDPANTNDTRAKVYVIDSSSNSVTSEIELDNGAESIRGIAASSDGAYVYVSHILAHYQLPTTQLDGGWVNSNVISVISTADKKVSYGFTLDDVDLGAANPWGLALSEDGNSLYVALSGTNQVVCVDLNRLSTLVRTVERGNSTLASSLDQTINQINFASAAKKRLTLSGAGVRSLLYSNGKLYVGEYFAGNVEVVDAESFSAADTITVKEQPENNQVRQGELYWHDATICYQMWQSCSSCHPDARASGLNWDELGDGMGTPKQTKSMLYSMRTPPCLATGVEINAEHNVFGSVSGTPIWNKNSDANDISNSIIAFLRSLVPVASPYLNDNGTLTEAASHGKELFAEYSCTVCHPAPLYTDMKFHDMGTTDFDESWEDREIDTPTLVEVWRSAPWSYIGHFTDMTECVKYFAERTGKTISDADAYDLAQYVLSIGAENEQYGVVQVTNSDTTYNTFSDALGIKALSVVKQKIGAPDAILTLTVYDSAGSAIGSTTLELKDMTYGVVYDFELESELNMSGGAYYAVVIKDSSGNSLASDLKILKID